MPALVFPPSAFDETTLTSWHKINHIIFTPELVNYSGQQRGKPEGYLLTQQGLESAASNCYIRANTSRLTWFQASATPRSPRQAACRRASRPRGRGVPADTAGPHDAGSAASRRGWAQRHGVMSTRRRWARGHCAAPGHVPHAWALSCTRTDLKLRKVYFFTVAMLA